MRRQCEDWAQPSGSLTAGSLHRDQAVATAAGILLDLIAYHLNGAPPEPAVTRCSPLVNADCPGHTAPPYCDPAPFSPTATASVPDWATPDTNPADDAAGATA